VSYIDRSAIKKRRFGEKRGCKGAKGQSYRRKHKNKIKTKAKTVNKNLDKRSQTITFAKASKTNTQTDRNRDLDEAAPEATSDTERIPES
jgi:hypothetical protein